MIETILLVVVLAICVALILEEPRPYVGLVVHAHAPTQFNSINIDNCHIGLLIVNYDNMSSELREVS